MTVRNLNFLFQPKSCADRRERGPELDRIACRGEPLAGGFPGEIGFVNLGSSVLGKPCYSSSSACPSCRSSRVVATPPHAVPGVIAELGRKGCRAAVVITAGVTGDLAQKMREAARPYLLRIIGPNCLGIQVPYLNLDASFAQTFAKRGDIALVSQSGAMMTAMLDWAAVEGVGFSHVVSIGDAADVDLGDMLDYLAGEVMSRAVFLYIEGIAHAAKFMSAARRCSRSKPVIAIKSGRHPEGAKAAAFAHRRAGRLRPCLHRRTSPRGHLARSRPA